MAGEEALNFLEVFNMLNAEHEREVEELKEELEEKGLVIAKLTRDLEKKEASRKEAVERAELWYRMNIITEKLIKMKLTPEKDPEIVLTEKDSFLEKGQRKPGKKKLKKVPSQKKQAKMMRFQMNQNMMIPMTRQMNWMTAATITPRENVMRNPRMNQMNNGMTNQRMHQMNNGMTNQTNQMTKQMMKPRTNQSLNPTTNQMLNQLRTPIMNQEAMNPMMIR